MRLTAACALLFVLASPPAAREDVAAAARVLDAAVAGGDVARIRAARDAIAVLQAAEPGVPELDYALALADWRLVPLLPAAQKPAAKQLCKEGIAACERALAARPKLADAMALESGLQGVAFQFLSSQAAISLASEMEERFARAAALEPDNPRVLLLRGLHELHKPRDVGGGPARALPLLERATTAFATAAPAPGGIAWGHADAWIWHGIAASRAGDWARARADFRRALEVQPGHAWVERVLLPEAEKRAAGAKGAK